MASSMAAGDSECMDSQCLAELSTMFPSIEYSVLVSVLEAHNGRLETTVEYFMDNPHSSEHHLPTIEDPSHDLIGQFSEDIGGLPEMLPSFMFETRDTTDEDSSTSRTSSPSPDSNVDSDDDPLPTYEEACTDADRLPEAVVIEDDLGDVYSEGMGVYDGYPEGQMEELRGDEQAVAAKPTESSAAHRKKLRKVRKLAGKLKGKRLKVKIAKGKRSSESSVSAREGYAPLSSDQELEHLDEDDDSS